MNSKREYRAGLPANQDSGIGMPRPKCRKASPLSEDWPDWSNVLVNELELALC